MVSSRYKHVISPLINPIAAACVRVGVSPTAITLAAPLLATIASLWFARTRAVLPFCGAILAIGCLDALDGAVARAGGRASKLGAYLDAMADRYLEAIVILAVAYVTGYWFLSMVMLAGSMMVSYAKARAAMEVTITNKEWPDLAERTERGLVYLAGLAAGAVIGWRPLEHDLFWWTLLVLSVLTHATVLQRIFRARRYILARQ